MRSILNQRQTDLRAFYTDGCNIATNMQQNVMTMVYIGAVVRKNVFFPIKWNLWLIFLGMTKTFPSQGQHFSNLFSSTYYEDHVWGNSIGGSLLKKKTLHLFCETLYRVDADVLFVGVLHLIHYSWPAREIVESESIQKDHDRACCSAELPVNYRLTSRLHASKNKSFLFTALACVSYRLLLSMQSASTCINLSIWYSFEHCFCLWRFNQEENKSELGILWALCRVESGFHWTVCTDTLKNDIL